MPKTEAAIPAWVASDIEWASTIHALRAPALIGKGLIETYVDFDRHAIEWEQLHKDSELWSHGERQLIGFAFEMWTGCHREEDGCSLVELVGTVDDANLRHVIETVRIRRHWTRFEASEKTSAREDLAVRIDFLKGQLIALENELEAMGLPVIRQGAGLSGFAINTLSALSQALRGTWR